MKRTLANIAVLGLAAATISACKPDNKSPIGANPSPPPVGTTPPAAPSSNLGDRISAAFGAIFGKGANTEPSKPSATDVPPVSNTAEPIDF